MKVAMVTGASSGFGEATARQLIALGWCVIGTGRRAERLQALAAELGEHFHPLVFDVSERKGCEEAVASLPPALSSIDLLVNNAGLALGLEPAHEAELDNWQRMIETNINGLIVMTRLISPGMVERGSGTIINISSVAANYAYPGANVYGATKAFVSQFSLNLRADLHGSSVRVTSIEPGLCKTEFSLVRFGGDAKAADVPYADTEFLSADDVASAVVWVAEQPAHININRLELMPVSQSFAGFPIHRKN
jgi:3-hydroxy acid dehydrogenase/malonic semialdehyde reductase